MERLNAMLRKESTDAAKECNDEDVFLDEELLVVDTDAGAQGDGADATPASELLDKVFCPLCCGTLRVPVLACNGCGFHACGVCLRRWERESRQCPLKCDKHVRFEERPLAQVLGASVVARVRARCPFSRAQDENARCPAVLPYDALHAHVRECAYRTVTCPHSGCRQTMPRAHLAAHDAVCAFWEGKCRHCLQHFRRAAWDDHSAHCDKQTVDCVNKKRGCKVRPQRAHLQKHAETQCLYRTQKCPHCARGVPACKVKEHIAVACDAVEEACAACHAPFARRKLSEHVRECAHVTVVCERCHARVARAQYAQHVCGSDDAHGSAPPRAVTDTRMDQERPESDAKQAPVDAVFELEESDEC